MNLPHLPGVEQAPIPEGYLNFIYRQLYCNEIGRDGGGVAVDPGRERELKGPMAEKYLAAYLYENYGFREGLELNYGALVN